MTAWEFRLIPAAENDFARLDGSQKKLVVKALDKLVLNPLPQSEGGYGSPLGNRSGSDLSGFLKLKLRGAGLRIVYDLRYENQTAYVIIIGMREDGRVYKEAELRIDEYRQWLQSQQK